MEFDQFFSSFTCRYKLFESMTIYCSVNMNTQIHNKPGKMTQSYTWLDLRVSYYFFKENFSFEKSLFDIPGEKFIGVGLDVTATSVKQLFPKKIKEFTLECSVFRNVSAHMFWQNKLILENYFIMRVLENQIL